MKTISSLLFAALSASNAVKAEVVIGSIHPALVPSL